MSIIKNIIKQLIDNGLAAIPVKPKTKTTTLPTWKPYQSKLPSFTKIDRYITSESGIAVICGEVSQNLEAIDFDNDGSEFLIYMEILKIMDPQLADKLYKEKSPNGYHILYKCEEEVGKSTKLASQQNASQKGTKTLIETRGQGAYIIIAPTKGYERIQGDINNLPTISTRERNLLHSIAKSLDKSDIATPNGSISMEYNQKRPGDIFQKEGDIKPILLKNGWTLVKDASKNENSYWRRPGKPDGVSATLKDNIFYNFSSNALPFEANKAYNAISALAFLEHEGDFSKAAKELVSMGYTSEDYEDNLPPVPICKPELIDEALFNVPGFLNNFYDHCISNSPYPNKVMSFGAGLTCLSHLTAPIAQNEFNARPNLIIIGLANSSSGKDFPRKVIFNLLSTLKIGNELGDSFASAEGLEDALASNRSLFYLTDEFDSLLNSLNDNLNVRYSNLTAKILTIYTSADSSLPMRKLARSNNKKPIKNPCLTIFGTAIPTSFYSTISPKMLKNGLVGRMIVLESYPKEKYQMVAVKKIPDEILSFAKQCIEMRKRQAPSTLKHTPEAIELALKYNEIYDHNYRIAEKESNQAGISIWGRSLEMCYKLAMLYALSVNVNTTEITAESMEWAYKFQSFLVKRMLHMIEEHAGTSEMVKKMNQLRDTMPLGKGISHSALLKKAGVLTGELKPLIDTLIERGDVVQQVSKTATKSGIIYKRIR